MQVHDAIEVLRKSGEYQTALAVARCRLPEDHETIANILTSWATRSIQVPPSLTFFYLNLVLLRKL
jgi:hypothetical protein